MSPHSEIEPIEKLDKFVIDVGRQFHFFFLSLVKNCEFLDVSTTGIHSIITGRSCVISMDLSVCYKQIEEEWRQRIFVVAKHKFSSIERTDMENISNSNLENTGAVCSAR